MGINTFYQEVTNPKTLARICKDIGKFKLIDTVLQDKINHVQLVIVAICLHFWSANNMIIKDSDLEEQISMVTQKLEPLITEALDGKAYQPVLSISPHNYLQQEEIADDNPSNTSN